MGRLERMQAKIMRYRVPKSMKRALFIRNGSIYENIAIHIGKTFSKEDAKKILEKIEKGRF